MNMKTLLIAICLALAVVFAPGCGKTLEPGGAYAPAGQQPDKAFYVADAAYQLGYKTIDAAFNFERDNRQYLWSVSPQIKHKLDEIRPQAVAANAEYLNARATYMKYPVPANLTTLQTVLGKIQQLAVTAQGLLPKQ